MKTITEFINEALTGGAIGDLYDFQPGRSMNKDFEAKYIPIHILDVNKLKKDIKIDYKGSNEGETAYYSIIEILNGIKFDKNTKKLEKSIDDAFAKYVLKGVKFESYAEFDGDSLRIQLICTSPTISGNGREVYMFVFDEK